MFQTAIPLCVIHVPAFSDCRFSSQRYRFPCMHVSDYALFMSCRAAMTLFISCQRVPLILAFVNACLFRLKLFFIAHGFKAS